MIRTLNLEGDDDEEEESDEDSDAGSDAGRAAEKTWLSAYWTGTH